MSHFAKINPNNNTVEIVIVAEQEFIDSGAVGNPALWIQTSYNTFGGNHLGKDQKPDGGQPLRKNYAGIGDTYDRGRDAFIPPKTHPDATLNEDTCQWEKPTPE
jgi:hypothetical protein